MPGRTYLLTRRCSQRQFLLKPSPLTNQIVRYCLALAATHTGVMVHAVCFMSNHWHGIVSDPFARLPEFLERFHRLFARAQNVALGRVENLWSSDKPSVVLLASDEDVLDKLAYVIANPTAAGLVESPSEWPGVVTRRLAERWSVSIPDVFFDPTGDLPELIELEFIRPPIFLSLDLADLALRLNAAIQQRVRVAREQMRARGLSFLGRRAALQASSDGMPRLSEPRRIHIPRVAALDYVRRKQAYFRLREFLRSYRIAWEGWRSGRRDVVFPAGTYALRVQARVACQPMVPS